MSRFFYTAGQRQGNEVTLTGDDANHLRRVLRSGPGDEIELCDEAGGCRLAAITAVEKESVSCQLGMLLPDSEARVRIYLAFALLKGEKTDFVLQKATELGVAGFLPFISERTISRPDKKTEARLQRWEKIIRAAAGQSRRSLLPSIAAPLDWTELVKTIPAYQKAVLFWEGEKNRPLAAALEGISPAGNLLLITGPEGGFSREEALAAADSGACPVTLGPRILRAETAALTAVAVSLYQLGEMEGRP
ncbi:MAG: RsmE family RNA methyltransferase [Bacillota bacterium]|nr:RsmE family RNA methyltransferase [Bacillota bacterium]MDW7683464.1 RsmE family RNA methyltransferase [Bacillota bacterium]